MKLFSAAVLFAGLSLVASKLAAEEVPLKPAETKPHEGKLAEAARLPDAAKPEDPKKNPFVPSALMRMRAQKPVEDAPAPSVAAPVSAVSHARPVLEGVLVKNNSVLASFRLGNKSIVIEPRNTFMADDVTYMFIGYANECATLRDEDGHIHDLRIVQHASSAPKTPQRVPDPNSNQ